MQTPYRFNDDFQHNKEALNKLADISTVSLRNKVAGYITRYRHVLANKI